MADSIIPRLVPCPPLTDQEIADVTRVVFGPPVQSYTTGLLWVFGNSSTDYDLITLHFCQGRLSLILFTGGTTNVNEETWDLRSFAAAGRDELLLRNIPEHVILVEEESTNTLEEVKNGRALLMRRGFMPATILYASSAHHLGRCYLTLRHYFPVSRLVALPFYTVRDGVEITPTTWHEHQTSRDRVWGEFQRILLYSSRGDIAKPTLP